MKNEENHKKLLTQVLFELLDKKLIEHPYQVAIGKVDIINSIGNYEYFSADAFPVLNYMHPLLDDTLLNTYREFLQILESAEKIINSKNGYKKQQKIERNYDFLKTIEFPNSLSSEFFLRCLTNNQSQEGAVLSLNRLDYLIQDDPEKKLLCDLEQALFLWGDNPYYLCVFYDYIESQSFQIFHFIVFCLQKKSAAIGEIVQSAISKFKDAKLLEEFKDNYTDCTVNRIIYNIKNQLSSNIRSNSLNAVNRDDWKKASYLFDQIIDLKSINFISYDKLKVLIDVSKTQLADGFINEINKL